MAKTISFPGGLKKVSWGQALEVTFEGAKKPETIISGLTGSIKDFIKDYEEKSEKTISKVSFTDLSDDDQQ